MKRLLPSGLMLLATCCLLVAGVLPAHGRTLRVSPDGDDSDGITWATAFQTIAGGVEAATSGDQIWVESATYQEVLTLKSGVSIFGGFDGTEAAEDFDLRNPDGNLTLIDGSGLGQSVMTAHSVGQVVLDGIVLTGGESRDGAGVDCVGSSLTLRNCTIRNNHSQRSGGGIHSYSSSVKLVRCTVSDNVAEGIGGGICSYNDSLTLDTCILTYNRSFEFGGGLRITEGTAHVNNSIISDNYARREGGGIICAENGIVYITHCTLSRNYGVPEAVAWGVFCHAFFPNVGEPYPEAIVTNSIFADQSRPLGGNGTISVAYSDIVGVSVEGEGNINIDPQFVGGSPFDYHLRANSPCIDSGTKVDLSIDLDGNPRPVDVPDVGHAGEFAFDMGAYEWQLPRADLDGNGKVDSKDLMMFQGEWMTDAGATTE